MYSFCKIAIEIKFKKIAGQIYLAYMHEFNLTVLEVLFIMKDNFITEIEHFRNETFMTYFF